MLPRHPPRRAPARGLRLEKPPMRGVGAGAPGGRCQSELRTVSATSRSASPPASPGPWLCESATRAPAT